MSLEQRPDTKKLPLALLSRAWHAIKSNWKLKLISLVVAITIWGALISEDATLTREKTFNDVAVSVTGADTLQRNGYVVIDGLDNLPPIRMRAEVPQKAWESALPAYYSVRVDVSRITATGTQSLPILTSSTSAYGTVEWLSTEQIQVTVDEYITRRRVPVRLAPTGQVPSGLFASSAIVDPADVVVSGPRSLVSRVSHLLANYNQSALVEGSGLQYSAVPFRIIATDGSELASKHIAITNENVLLDTLLVEQAVYPMKQVDINLTGLTRGKVLDGYEITGITADPPFVRIAGREEDLEGVTMLDLNASIDVTGLSESFIRALRVEKPAGAQYISDNAVYVTINIQPLLSEDSE